MRRRRGALVAQDAHRPVDPSTRSKTTPPEASHYDVPLAESIRNAATPIEDIETDDMSYILDAIGDARIVLLGEATHGTSEFYRMRARLTRELIEHKDFRIVAVEADWPDAARIDHHIRGRSSNGDEWAAFAGFPTWKWRNLETARFIAGLRTFNRECSADEQVGFYGLDLYSMKASVKAVLRYLDEVDPRSAKLARDRYACLGVEEPGHHTAYLKGPVTPVYEDCEHNVVQMLADLLRRRIEHLTADRDRYFDTVQNARLVRNAERYYRTLYRGDHSAWNLRSMHMADTLEFLLLHHKRDRAVVWAHNAHVGDARYTERAARGEFNLGQIVKQRHDLTYALGFGTYQGTVTAAHEWEGETLVIDVPPADPRSHEHLMHGTALPRFFISLADLKALEAPRLQRAIGVIYRPDDEPRDHYTRARLGRQFDGYVWFDRTEAVTPLPALEVEGVPDTYPFGV